MEGYMPGLLRPSHVAPPPHPGGHPGPPGGLPPPRGLPPPGLVGGGPCLPPDLTSSPWSTNPPGLSPLGPPPPGALGPVPTSLGHGPLPPGAIPPPGSLVPPGALPPPPGGALVPPYRSLYGDAMTDRAADLHKELDYQRLAESHRLGELRAAEVRYLASSGYAKDPVTGLPLQAYPGIYPPSSLLSTADPYAAPFPPSLHPAVTAAAAAAVYPPSSLPPPPANNSGLSERLRVGFGERSPNNPLKLHSQERVIFTTAQPTLPSTLVSSTHSSYVQSLKRPEPKPEDRPKPDDRPVAAEVRSRTAPQVDDDDEVEIIEDGDEDEEVLVEDFDGECCRTYPYNHSKILRWREEKNRKEAEKKIEEDKRKEEERRREEEKRREEERKKEEERRKEEERKKEKPQPSPKTESLHTGSIPVGIVSARQRSEPDKLSLRPDLRDISSLPGRDMGTLPGRDIGAIPGRDMSALPGRDMGSMPLPPSGPLVSTIGLPTSSAWSSAPPGPWGLTPHPPPPGRGIPPYPPSPWCLPPGHPMMGPIPMGYQLAKDPMTGQILLIPTDPNQRPSGGMWPGFEPPTSSASQHLHQLMMQQHQHYLHQQDKQQYLQHAELLRQGLLPPGSLGPVPPGGPLPPHRTRVPETITVSDDDDEETSPKEKSAAVEPPNHLLLSKPPPALKTSCDQPPPAKPPSPPRPPPATAGTIKQEQVIKTELKTEVLDVAPTKSELAVSVKQEADVKAETAELMDDVKTGLIHPSEGFLEPPVDDEEVEDDPEPLDPGSLVEDEEAENLTVEAVEATGAAAVVQTKTEVEATTTTAALSERCVVKTERESSAEISTEEQVNTPVSEQLEAVKTEEKPQILARDEVELRDAENLLFFSEQPEVVGDLINKHDNFDTEEEEELEPFIPCLEEEPLSGLDILVQGIKRMDEIAAKQNPGLDLLCYLTRNDTIEYSVDPSVIRSRNLDMELLCSITQTEYQQLTSWVEPIIRLKELYNVRLYPSEVNERAAKLYIEEKIREFTKDHPDNMEAEKFDNIKALGKMIKKIKNMEIMSQEEVNIRMKITELQNNYREKQTRLSKLKTPRKRNLKAGKGRHHHRGPGRPKKKKFPNPRVKMGRPRKQKEEPATPITSTTTAMMVARESRPSTPEPRGGDDPQDSDAPPVLEPQTPATVDDDGSSTSNSGPASLLKPPRLTASSPPPRDGAGGGGAASNTSLSTLTSKFMKGKANPFANLLSQLTAAGPSSTTAEAGSGEDLETGGKFSDESGSGSETTSSFKFGKTSKLSYCLEAYQHNKKRKADKPKKNSGGGSSETIVPKKPKNLFMMLDFQRGFGVKNAEDEYNFEDSDGGEPPKMLSSPIRRSSTPSAGSGSQWSDDENTEKSKKKRKDISMSAPENTPEKPAKAAAEVRSAAVSYTENAATEAAAAAAESGKLRSARLTATDLKDGLRILVLQDGKFWPARLNSTKLPDVYGVVIDSQRGNRPTILPRDDILKEAVLEVRPSCEADLRVGARVCTYWSSAYACLFPATVSTPDDPLPKGQILVELDDGDSRLVEISRVRMLPQDYSRVVYDPDPIASLRKRRISTDSHDSGTSHHQEKSADFSKKSADLRKFSKSGKELGGGNEPKKLKISYKRKKKLKKLHKHCDKHRRGTAVVGETKHLQKYAVRSPPRANHPPVQSEESSDDSLDHSNNSSDEEEEHCASSPRPMVSLESRGGWRWVGEGYRRPGVKGKSKKVFYKTIQRGDSLLHVNDCAVFLSTGRSDRPYIGRIEMMWETVSGFMMTKVKWFYHPQEIETGGRKFDLKLPGGLFQSPHTDENSVLTISHKCYVLPVKEYQRYHNLGTASDLYYLAGSYDPAGLTLNFQPGVLKSQDSD